MNARYCDSVNGPVRSTRRCATNVAPRRQLRHCRCSCNCCSCSCCCERCTRRAVIVPVRVKAKCSRGLRACPVLFPPYICYLSTRLRIYLDTAYLNARCRLSATVSSGGRLSHATTNHDAGFTAAVSLADAPPRSPAMPRSASHGRQAQARRRTDSTRRTTISPEHHFGAVSVSAVLSPPPPPPPLPPPLPPPPSSLPPRMCPCCRCHLPFVSLGSFIS